MAMAIGGEQLSKQQPALHTRDTEGREKCWRLADEDLPAHQLEIAVAADGPDRS